MRQTGPGHPARNRPRLDLVLDLCDRAPTGCGVPLINRHIEASVVHLLDADRNSWDHALANPESVLYFCQVGLRLFDLGERRLDLGLEITTINFEEGISRPHSASPFHEYRCPHSCNSSANGNVSR